MRLPTYITLAFIAFIMMFATAVTRSPGPQSTDLALGYVMGKDFTALMSNPNLTMKVVRGEKSVAFVWTSENPARLNEIAEMGEHINAVRQMLEISEPPGQDMDDYRTAANW